MKALTKISKEIAAMLVLAACVMGAGANSAMAQEQGAVQRVAYQGETHTGMCCSNWGDPIKVNEPERLAPIVVTFSTDYQSTSPFLVALRVNDGPCTFYGPAFLAKFAPEDWTFASTTFQWVIMPGDYKLAKGPNTIQLCGGSTQSPNDTLTLGFYTLSARLQK